MQKRDKEGASQASLDNSVTHLYFCCQKGVGDALDNDVQTIVGPPGQAPETSRLATKDEEKPNGLQVTGSMSAGALEKLLADYVRNILPCASLGVGIEIIEKAVLWYGHPSGGDPIRELIMTVLPKVGAEEVSPGVYKAKRASRARASGNVFPAKAGAINAVTIGHVTIPVPDGPRSPYLSFELVAEIALENPGASLLLVHGLINRPDGSDSWHMWIETDYIAFDPALQILAPASQYRDIIGARVVGMCTPKDVRSIPGPPAQFIFCMGKAATATEGPGNVTTPRHATVRVPASGPGGLISLDYEVLPAGGSRSTC